ncbi:MAG: phospholipase D-like domain-containing protein [Chloroflexia bacterium]
MLNNISKPILTFSRKAPDLPNRYNPDLRLALGYQLLFQSLSILAVVPPARGSSKAASARQYASGQTDWWDHSSNAGIVQPDQKHKVAPLIDGAMIYASAYNDLLKARRRIYITTWALEDNFIIDRSHGCNVTLGDFCAAALTEHPKLDIYILVWDWAGWAQRALVIAGRNWGRRLLRDLPLPLPTKGGFANLREASQSNRLHITFQANASPNPFGTHHQKFILTDLEGEEPSCNSREEGRANASLHCMGLNFMNIYWDTLTHSRPGAYPEMTEHAWQHDTGIRVQGPLIKQFEDEFDRRWLAATGVALPPNQFDCKPQGSTGAMALIHREQTTRPVPVKQWYLQKIQHAHDFIYLENQYFDDIDVTKALCAAYLAAEVRGEQLPVAVVLPWLERLLPLPHHPMIDSNLHRLERLLPFPPWHPFTWWTHYNVTNLRVRTAKRFKVKGREPNVRPVGGWPEVRQAIDPDAFLKSLASSLLPGSRASRRMTWWKLFVTSRHFKVLVGDRWVEWKNIEWIEGGIDVYRMMSTTVDWPPTPVYVHSKLGIIDDSYMIGSSNIAKQSFVTDSEIDIAVQGSEEVERLITLLWTVLIGASKEYPANGSAWLQAFRRVAAQNAANAHRAARGIDTDGPRGLLLPWRPFWY